MGTACSLAIKDVFSNDMVEMDVCSSHNVLEGELKEVEIEGHKVVIMREKGQVRAFRSVPSLWSTS